MRMRSDLSRQLADRDPLLGTLGWRAALLYADPCAFDRWLWIRRSSLPGRVRTLDAGSGNGAFAMYAARRGNEVTALSYSASDQARAERRAKAVGLGDIRFLVADLREVDRLEAELGPFDQAYCLEVIEHILDDRKLLRDLARLIRPGGRLLLTTPYRRHRPVFGEGVNDREDGSHVRAGYTHEEMDRLLAEAGFSAVSHAYVSGVLSQLGFNVMYRLNAVFPHLGWVLTLPLRLLAPLDRVVTRITRRPYLSIGVVATRD
jgi:SAM-dependent methyltransferase